MSISRPLAKISWQSQIYNLFDGANIIGRDSNRATASIDHASVSDLHAVIYIDSVLNRFEIYDLRSNSGTFARNPHEDGFKKICEISFSISHNSILKFGVAECAFTVIPVIQPSYLESADDIVTTPTSPNDLTHNDDDQTQADSDTGAKPSALPLRSITSTHSATVPTNVIANCDMNNENDCGDDDDDDDDDSADLLQPVDDDLMNQDTQDMFNVDAELPGNISQENPVTRC